MAATIARSCLRLNSCTHRIKYLQVGSAIPPTAHNPAVLKDVCRSAWYRSFFRSDQPAASNEKPIVSADTVDTGPSKPKRPANAFLLYLQGVQDGIKQVNPDFKRQQIIKEASKRWKELDPETKSKFAIDRKEKMEKYKGDMMNYIENRTPEQIEMEKKEKEKQATKKLKKTRKQLGMPTKPITAFASYVSEKLVERSDEPIQHYFKQVKESWNNMPDHERKVYFDRSMESNDQYQNAMADWEERMIETGRFDVLRKKTLKKLKTAEQGKGKIR